MPSPRPAIVLSAEPRQAAFQVLKETASGRTPEESLARLTKLLSPRDRNLATALVYEVLRHRAFLDWLAASRLARGRAAPDLALILRLGLAQLLYFGRLGEHAAVAETVALAKKIIPGRHGLVNATLRGLLREREAGAPWPPAAPPGSSPAALALRHSYPLWLAEDLLKRFGPAETEEILAAGNRPTPPTLRVNPLRATREELGRLLPFPVAPTPFSPWGLKTEVFAGRPEDWPGFAEGLFSLQDEASQLAGLLAGKNPASILDACAGLGGKALHLAALYPDALITARDRLSSRLERLAAEAGRLGLRNIKTERRDLLEPQGGELFDLVLVDAPCAGLGVIRRRPDLKWNKKAEDVPRLAELQLRLLLAGADQARRGGRLIYGVCSFSLAEGPDTAARFLAARPDYRAASDWPAALKPLLSPEGLGLALWPHRHAADGFFWAVFERL